MSENDEVCRLLETLDEWEEVALHLGLSDKTIQEIRRLSNGNNLRKEVMVSRWVQCKDLEPSWSKLEEALVRANQEPHAAKIRTRQRTPTNPAITATNSDDLPEASDSGKGNACIYIQILGFLRAHGQSIVLSDYFYSTYRN